MDFLHNRTLKSKLVFLSATAVVVLMLNTAWSLFDWKRDLIDERELKTRHLVEAAYSLVEHYHRLQKAGLPEAEAQKQAIDALNGMRYESREYFWIHDLARPVPKMVMHATVPALNGKVLDDPKFNKAVSLKAGVTGAVVKLDGKNLFVAMNEAIDKAGSGFVKYLWPKPLPGGGVSPELYTKTSFVKKFEPWGWVVGSGIYIDDVNDKFVHQVAVESVIAGLSLVLLLVLSALLNRSIIRQLGGEPRDAKRVVEAIAQGDLSVDIPTRPGDTTSLLVSMKQMQASLRALVAQVHDAAHQLTMNSAQLSQTSHLVANSTNDQSSAVYSMAASVEVMTYTIDSIAENAHSAKSTAAEAGVNSDRGFEVVQEAASEIHKISEAVKVSSQQIETLGEQSQQISAIVSVIKDIAEQTNLLALNAAIEAARAGEQGRGFAVVADEVRKLAERTAKSTHEIASMITAIQQGTASAVAGMAQGSALVTEGVRMANQAGEVMALIKTGMENVIATVNDISASLENESEASSQISENVQKMAAKTEENTTAISKVAEAADNLKQLSHSMEQTVDAFRL